VSPSWHCYILLYFEDCSEEKYTVMMEKLASVDLTKIVEEDDNTDVKGEAACVGGACEIT